MLNEKLIFILFSFYLNQYHYFKFTCYLTLIFYEPNIISASIIFALSYCTLHASLNQITFRVQFDSKRRQNHFNENLKKERSFLIDSKEKGDFMIKCAIWNREISITIGGRCTITKNIIANIKQLLMKCLQHPNWLHLPVQKLAILG